MEMESEREREKRPKMGGMTKAFNFQLGAQVEESQTDADPDTALLRDSVGAVRLTARACARVLVCLCVCVSMSSKSSGCNVLTVRLTGECYRIKCIGISKGKFRSPAVCLFICLFF